MNALLADLTSGDRTRVWSSSCAVIRLRDPAALDELASALPWISEKTEGVALGGAMFSNAEHLRFALRKLEYHRSRAGCMCRLYPEYIFFNPRDEERAGNVEIVGVTYVDETWVDAYACTCTECGAGYRVEERESHYTWWGWRAVALHVGDSDGPRAGGPAV